MTESEADLIPLRLRAELTRLGLSARQAAAEIGEKNDNRLKQMLNGRQRISADMLSALVTGVGVNGHYVLTGEQSHGVDIDTVRGVMQQVQDAEALGGDQLSHEQRIQVVCVLLKTTQATGAAPSRDAVITALQSLL